MNKSGIAIVKNINPIVFSWGFFLLLNFGFIAVGLAQKVVEKTWDANAFVKLEIISDDVFKIKIVTEQTSEIKLTSQIEGENFENLNIGASEKGKTLTLKPSYRPYFKPQNDKLAAHKLISIEMILTIPETMEVYINAKIASLEMQGKIQKLDVNLRDGHCVLSDFLGNATLNTKQGDIKVFANAQVYGSGFSKNGCVKNTLANTGIFLIKAESVNGNISLLKTQE